MVHRSRLHRLVQPGALALLVLLGTLFLAAPAQAAETCDTYGAGSQAYAECAVRGGDRDVAPGVPPAGRQPGAPISPVVAESSTEVWQLGVAGLVGAGIALGAAIGVSRLGQRQRVAAH